LQISPRDGGARSADGGEAVFRRRRWPGVGEERRRSINGAWRTRWDRRRRGEVAGEGSSACGWVWPAVMAARRRSGARKKWGWTRSGLRASPGRGSPGAFAGGGSGRPGGAIHVRAARATVARGVPAARGQGPACGGAGREVGRGSRARARVELTGLPGSVGVARRRTAASSGRKRLGRRGAARRGAGAGARGRGRVRDAEEEGGVRREVEGWWQRLWWVAPRRGKADGGAAELGERSGGEMAEEEKERAGAERKRRRGEELRWRGAQGVARAWRARAELAGRVASAPCARSGRAREGGGLSG
jgi:hypothetical protein